MTEIKSLSKASFLIILMGSLGDVVRGLCVPTHIKKCLPDCRITWLVEPKWVQIVESHPSVDEVIVFNRPLNALGVVVLYRKLKKFHFDVTLDLQRHLKSGFFSFLSRSKRRIGFHRLDAKEMNWIFNNERINCFGEDLPKFLHYLKFPHYLGLPKPDKINFGFSSMDVDAHLPAGISALHKPYIGIVMGASWQSKDWPIEYYEELIRHIISDSRYGVVLLGDHSKRAFAESISNQMDSANLLNLADKTSLLELSAILKNAVVNAGPDSGPGHISAAVGTPYVSFFGPTRPARVAPYGCEHLVVRTSAPCAPCNKKNCPDHEDHCMRLITPKLVVEKLDDVLA